MSTHLVCPICNREFKCDGPHVGPHDALSPIEPCPLSKGSLYVFVKDDAGFGIPGVMAHCGVSSGPTLAQGFAYFEQLEAHKYDTLISLEESTKTVRTDYYSTTRTSVSAAVEKGKITIVEYVLNRYADLLVTLKREDGESDLPKAAFEVTSAKHTLDQPVRDVKDGESVYSKLMPTEFYTVECKLLEEEGRKNFKLVEARKPDQKVSSLKREKVEFVLKSRYWIDLAFVDKKDPEWKGSFTLHPEKREAKVENDVGHEFRHVPDLTPEKMNIDAVAMKESRVFVSIG